MSSLNVPNASQLPSAVSKPEGGFLALEPETFLPCFNRQACFVRHRLVDHPYFDLHRLFDLAQRLPAKYVRINSGAVPVDATPAQIPGTGLSTEESFQRIAETNTRIMLKHIELDRDYGDLMNACLGELEALGHPATRGIYSRVGYVFISAPNQVTPYHMDPEVNFLLQIRGQKTFHVLSGGDRAVLSEEDIELFYAGKHSSLPYRLEAKDRATPFVMEPGSGVHIPVNHPHWVTTPNEVTISFALTFETDETRRRGTVYAFNHYLRSRGWRPTPYGNAPLRDNIKYHGLRTLACLKACLPGRRQEAAH